MWDTLKNVAMPSLAARAFRRRPPYETDGAFDAMPQSSHPNGRRRSADQLTWNKAGQPRLIAYCQAPTSG